MQLALQVLSSAFLAEQLVFLCDVGSMEHLQGLDVLGQGCLLRDDSLELLVLLLDSYDPVFVFPEQFFGLLLDALGKACNFLVLDNYLLVQIGPQLILSLVVLIPEFFHLVLEQEYLKLIIIDECGLHLLQFQNPLVQALNLLL